MISGRFVRTHYCDDVRMEVGGKYSLMGCYHSVMLLESSDQSSLVLPKLCASIEVVSPIEKPFVWLTVRALFNDELLGELSVSPEQMLATIEAGASPHISEPAWHAINAQMSFTPLVVGPTGGKLRIEVDTEDGVIKSNGLVIVVNGPIPAAGMAVAPAVV